MLGDDLTVVVPHYGSPVPTLRLLEQLADQATGAQVVVVDDASEEPFPDVAGVEIVRRETNGGFGSAVNSGVAVAQGRHLLILNSDLDLPAGFIPAFLTAAEPHGVGVFGPAIVNTAGQHEWSGRLFPTTRQHFIEWLSFLARFRPRLRAAVGYDLSCVPGQIGHPDWLVGAVLLMPTAAFRAVGGFDDIYFMNSEEVDLQRRLAAREIDRVYLGNVTVHHAGGGSSGDSLQRRRWLVRSRRQYARKWGGWRGEKQLQLALTAATVMNLAVNLARRLLGRSVNPVAVAREELNLIWKNGR